MSDEPAGFLKFLREGIYKGGFETDDVLAAVLPLMKQVLAANEAGLVAPLKGTDDLAITEQRHLAYPPPKVSSPEKNTAKVEALQAPLSSAVKVVGQSERLTDIDQGSLTHTDLTLGTDNQIVSPVYLSGYRSWEHAVGHHDELTDIFSLGMLTASVACGLDFTQMADLETFIANRLNLFALNRRLNPVIASVIVQMTELNRHKRAPDLAQMISRLEHYRDQPAEIDFSQLKGFKETTLNGKRRIIQKHLRDRLFEISRRNRLIYFKPTLQTLNLTVASVPLLLDYRNIKVEHLFVWHSELEAAITEGGPLSLGKYLRFEDAPYISGVLDSIISEARRDRSEFGFAQLRLALCFLRWNNLKEAPEERIHSPLLLLPVELTKKKGVRDSYVLDPITSEAEVNPALRHHLKELYNLNLPELVDLKETRLQQFYEGLRTQIQASEPGVMLELVDRPRIQLIHEKARQRVDQYRRRIQLQANRSRTITKPEYSYDPDDFRPLGLQLFLTYVRPTPMPLREALGALPQINPLQMSESSVPEGPRKVLAAEQRMYSLRTGENQNPYAWEFDLCNLTLGNFNYRKMALVRDYAKLIETDMGSGSFDTVFSLNPKQTDVVPASLELRDQNLIVPCDAAQSTAIARARTAASYIIQGPPGTGKSQTITNLIADYVARGKRVLFVCEKRAAIDVVYHRLRQQGLDELCCLIHDSQTDKKAFIQDLKQTYEKNLGQVDADSEGEKAREEILRAMDQDLSSIRRFTEIMRQPHDRTGLAVRSLLHRLVELRDCARELPPLLEDLLPDYPVWMAHREVVERLAAALSELGEDLRFSGNPLCWLGNEILQADRPVETLTRLVDQAEDLLDSVENELELTGLPVELRGRFETIREILAFALRIRFLSQRNLVGILLRDSASTNFEEISNQLDQKARALEAADKRTVGWKNALSPEDAQNALTKARRFENSIFRFLQPAYWRLKRTLQSRYDFSRHALPPAWTKILSDLVARYDAKSASDKLLEDARKQWQIEDVEEFCDSVELLQKESATCSSSLKTFLRHLADSGQRSALIENLVGIHDRFQQLENTLRSLLAEHDRFDLDALPDALIRLREQTGLLAELGPILSEFVELPGAMTHAMRHADIPLNHFEAAIARRSLNHIYRQDRAVSRFEGSVLDRKMDSLAKHYREWLALNARCIRAGVRRKFLEHVNVSALPASQVPVDQKALKKSYAAGRRELEHEFGKTMRYKAIRELATDDTGLVIKDLKPIWLMSPLSVSDTLPLDPGLFDVVIFDEASQIPLEEAVPALYRSHQVIVVGDEMQLPPTTFFTAGRDEDETVMVEEDGERFEFDLDSDSFLTQSAQNLPSTMLAWHYRSRYESLISFSNAAFYSGNLMTIPDRQCVLTNQQEIRVSAPDQGQTNADALLARSISFHLLEKGLYTDRRNPGEAAYIAQLVRGLLQRDTGLSIGIVAFSEAQQTEIENALKRLADEGAVFGAKLEAEFVREENDVFCGLFVKNLENVQGDERDIIIMSVCYGPDANGRMLMNFGPINQRGGEKRLNVIFSRAKHHMALVSSIRHHQITNEYNDGANNLRNFLHYAEAVSKGDATTARRVLESLNPLARKALAPFTKGDSVVEQLAHALRSRGHTVDLDVGQSRFRCDLAIRNHSDSMYQLGVLVDTERHYANPNLLDCYLMQPSILRAFGWRFALVLTKDWFHKPDDVVARLEKLLRGEEEASAAPEEEEQVEPVRPPTRSVETVPPEKPNVPDESSPQQASAPIEPQPSIQTLSSGPVRHFEFIGGGSRKFWEVSISGNSFTVRFGRIGTAGQSQTKSFPDEERARREAEKLIAEKVKKGYTETAGPKSDLK